MIRFTEPCPQCEGTEILVCRTCGPDGCMDLPDCDSDPCPFCISGTIPDDATVEAAADALGAVLGSGPFETAKYRASLILIAAARHQQEGQ
jgi:hypothetical protein